MYYVVCPASAEADLREACDPTAAIEGGIGPVMSDVDADWIAARLEGIASAMVLDHLPEDWVPEATE